MEYREILTLLILNGDPDAYHNWLGQQPLILQPAIAEEFIQIVQEIAVQKGIVLNEEDLKGYKAQIEKYEEAILDEQVAAVNLQIAEANADAANRQILENIDGVRVYIKECIITNADNADAMKQMALQVIQLEKDNDIYDEGNWIDVLHLL